VLLFFLLFAFRRDIYYDYIFETFKGCLKAFAEITNTFFVLAWGKTKERRDGINNAKLVKKIFPRIFGNTPVVGTYFCYKCGFDRFFYG